MLISFDMAKREQTLRERGLDFLDASAVFAGETATATDTRRDYGEIRFITAGFLLGRFVVIIWTPRDFSRRVISMRYGHDDERDEFFSPLG